MPQTTGSKTKRILEMLHRHPGLPNKKIAELLNGDPARERDGLHFKTTDVSQRRWHLKLALRVKGGTAGNGEENGEAELATPRPNTADTMQRLIMLINDCGGIQLFRQLFAELMEMHSATKGERL